MIVIDSDLPVPLSRAETRRIPLAVKGQRTVFRQQDNPILTIDLKGNLNLRNTTRGRRNVVQVKFTEKVVVLSHGSLTLVNLDPDGRLVVGGSREDLGLLGRNNRVSGNKFGHDTTSGLDTESQGADIDKKNITATSFAGQDTTLDSGTIGNSLVGVDALRRLLAVKVFLKELLNLGDTGGTTNKDDLRKQRSVLRGLSDVLHFALTSSISSFLTPASLRTCSTGFMVFLKRSMLSSSNLARVKVYVIIR